MADAIQDLQNLADDSTLQNQIDTVDANEHNTHRTNYRTQINLQKTVAEQQDNNYASATEPTLKSEGKIYADTTNDPAVLKYYQDGASNLQELVGTTLTQTLTNKTITSPTFTNGANGNVKLSRDLNLKINNNSTNPTFQLDISYDYFTFYDDNGLSYIRSQSIPIVIDVSVTGAGGRAASENGGSELSDAWYYVYIYDDGEGNTNGLLSLQPEWANVAAPDKPSGSNFIRRVSAVRNDSSGDFIQYVQIDDLISAEKTAESDIFSTSSPTYVLVDISSKVPETVKSAMFRGFNSNGGGVNNINTYTGALRFAPGGNYVNGASFTGNEIRLDDQSLYMFSNSGTTNFGIWYFRIHI